MQLQYMVWTWSQTNDGAIFFYVVYSLNISGEYSRWPRLIARLYMCIYIDYAAKLTHIRSCECVFEVVSVYLSVYSL